MHIIPYILATLLIILVLFINYTICLKVNYRNDLKKQLQVKSGIALIILCGIFIVVTQFIITGIIIDNSINSVTFLEQLLKQTLELYKMLLNGLSWFVTVIFLGIGVNLLTQGICLDNVITKNKSNSEIEKQVIQNKNFISSKVTKYIFKLLESNNKTLFPEDK